MPYEPMTIGMPLAVLAQVHRPEGVREVGSELEDVADLDPLAELQRRAADWAGIALAGVRDLGDVVRHVVAGHVHVPDVPAHPVGARDKVRRAGDQLVDDDDGVAGADGRAVARLHAARPDLLDRRRPEAANRLEEVRELRLVDVVVAADDGDHEAPIPGDEEGRLGRLRLRDAEEGAERIDRRRPRRLDVLHRQEVLGLRTGLADDRDLLVVGEIAVVAQDEGVLAEVVDDHELMGAAAAHDPDVRPDRDRIEPEPSKIFS